MNNYKTLEELIIKYDKKVMKLQQENKQLKQTLLDIKEYIEDNSTNTYLLKSFDVDIIIDIVNKALGDKENE